MFGMFGIMTVIRFLPNTVLQYYMITEGATVNNDFTPASCQTDHYFIICPSSFRTCWYTVIYKLVHVRTCGEWHTKFSPTYKNISTRFVGVCSQIENGHMHLWLNRHEVSMTFGTVFSNVKKVYWSKTFKRQKLNCAFPSIKLTTVSPCTTI